MPAPIACTARAKLNLSLHVTGRRDDGYHLLESFIAFTAFGDHLGYEAADTLSLTITGPFAEGLSAEDNLVIKAARLLAERCRYRGGARIMLEKNIPVGAGLGGGSCDAAAALKALTLLWNLSLPEADRQEIALRLGADVPVCLASAPAWVTGIGDMIEPVRLAPKVHVLLANPNKPLPTADVFRQYKPMFSAPVQTPEEILHFRQLIEFLAPLRNDLEAPAMTLLPEIAAMLAAIKSQPGCALARMSGSGATCFGLFEKENDVSAARNALAEMHPNWWSVATQL